MKTAIILIAAICLASSAQGQATKGGKPAAPAVPAAPAAPDPAPVVEAETPEKIIARFFSFVQRKEVDAAYDQLTKGTKIAERAEDVKTLKSKTKEAISVFGPVIGYDFVGKKHVGERLVSYTCVSLGKEFPLRWRFYFYKPADTWKLIDLRVDDRLAAMFDEPEEPRAGQ